MQLTVNGEVREISSENVSTLLKELDISGTHVAVAVNLQVIPRSGHESTQLNEGDKVEIVHAVGGG